MKRLAMLTVLGLMATALAATAALARPVEDAQRTAKAAPAAAKGGAAEGVVQKRGDMTIAAIAAGNPNFTTLVSLLQLTGLDAVVNSNDVTLTVFAPTNAAFTKLFTANPALPGILTSPAQGALGYPLLKNVLLYHVTDGRRFSNSVFNTNNTKTIDMLNGGTITTTPSLTILDGAGQTINPVPRPITPRNPEQAWRGRRRALPGRGAQALRAARGGDSGPYLSPAGW